jgi:uncharacterized protein (TIGR02687 family)
MDTKQVTEALAKLFEEQRIVFWNDPDKDFFDLITGKMFSPVDGVSVIRLDQTPALQAKIRIEREEPGSKFLLYSPTEEPEDPLHDWLFDIRLYSRCFYADRGSMDVEALGLKSPLLREHLNQRRKFLDNKERFQKLRNLATPDDGADDIDRKMVSVVVKSDQPEPYAILRSLLHAYTETGEDLDLREPIPAWEQIEKYDLHEYFWRTIKKIFGYAEESPSLANLVTRLFVTDFAQTLKGKPPQSLENLLLPPTGRSNCVVFMGQWRDSASRGSSYDQLSGYVADQIGIQNLLHGYDIEALIDVQTFLVVEQEIARSLKDRVINTSDSINVEDISAIITKRQAGHWASPAIAGTAPRKELHSVYEALVNAAAFFDIRNTQQMSFEYSSAKDMYRAYEKTLYRFDQLYRHFCEQADQTRQWDVLKHLREMIEAAYTNWFVPTLGLAWDKHVPGLLTNWRIDEIPNQYRFFDLNAKLRLEEAENRKVFVVISDAFRYEVAQELTQELNGKYRITATLGSQLGVLPSYTALGMASLLPHKCLQYDTRGAVLVDGRPSSSADQRNEILSKVEGCAIKADDLLSMRKEDGREMVAGKKVVYVYHDQIDSVGDKAGSEGETFHAARKAINEVSDLVRHIINNLNGNYVVVTADHGFLYSDTAPTEVQKSKLEEQPKGTVIAKKRYLLGRNLPKIDEAFHGRTESTAKASGDMEFYIPRGSNRFHFTGGARFVHGGAMLQEIVVPVVTIRQIKGKAKGDTATKKVDVQVLGVNHKITTPRYRFTLLQTEPVSDRVKAATLKVAVYEGSTAVTNIAAVTFDSESQSIEDRTKEVVLILADCKFDKRTKYRLILRDSETDIEQSSIDVTIDRAFSDDF